MKRIEPCLCGDPYCPRCFPGNMEDEWEPPEIEDDPENRELDTSDGGSRGWFPTADNFKPKR